MQSFGTAIAVIVASGLLTLVATGLALVLTAPLSRSRRVMVALAALAFANLVLQSSVYGLHYQVYHPEQAATQPAPNLRGVLTTFGATITFPVGLLTYVFPSVHECPLFAIAAAGGWSALLICLFSGLRYLNRKVTERSAAGDASAP